MADDDNTLSINVVRFQTRHDLPQRDQPPGQLFHGNDNNGQKKKSHGFIRGKNLAVGYRLTVTSTNPAKPKKWEGPITEAAPDQWTGPPWNEDPAWFFYLENTEYTPDPGQEDTVTVTVVVTASPSTTQSNTVTASPNPKDVP